MKKPKELLNLPKKYRNYKHLAEFYEKKYLEQKHQNEQTNTMFAPGHFYSPYPSLSEINERKETIFNRTKKDIAGINIREKEQLNLLKSLAKHYDKIPHTSKKGSLRYFFDNDAYSYTDSVILFCMLHDLKPNRIIEIGSGYSSAMMLDVNELFFKNKIDLTFIEPYPELLLSLVKPKDRKNFSLIDKNLSEVKDSVFSELEAGDILFVDSTHVSKVGSDVNQIFFNILPKLKKGVIIHIHDVFYPFEYPMDWVVQTRAWNEDYLLRAFLHNNHEYDILFFNHFMNIHHSSNIEKALPLTQKNSGGSLWLKKV